ncbi:uncharacterized protein LOC130949119 [Arachis stenosperma]|uniref:uncharacterized protein LOC130949119 n=1 Tax=Arachis stenosperma TaxID=217475 RepID=UPI0025AC1F1B|nr:uncharacterized protein LOC130949119 [Arachis stenosperma]
MAKTNAQESFQRVQEAKAKSRARAGGARVISPPPPPRNVGTLSKPIVISSSAPPQSLPVVRPSPDPKKRKTLESGASGEVKADAIEFVRKNIYPHVRIGMDDMSIRSHLTTMVEESLKAAGVCGKLLDIFEKAPLSSLGTTSKVEELEGRLRSYQEHEGELKKEIAKLREERDTFREKGKALQAQYNMEMELRKTAQASYQSLFKDLVSVKNDLLNSRKRIIESPPHSKDAPGSSAVPPISSSPMDTSGGAPPDSGGGDLPKK